MVILPTGVGRTCGLNRHGRRVERAVNITDRHMATTPPGDLRPGRRYPGLNDFGATLDMKDIDIIGTFAAELHCPPPLAALSILL
jgi:hypothetical protein